MIKSHSERFKAVTKSIVRLSGIGLVCAGLLSACSKSQYPQPPFEQVLDLSKSGLLFEKTFTVPANREWAPQKLEFGQSHTNYEVMLRFTDTEPGRFEREVEEADELWSKNGHKTETYERVSLWRVVGLAAPRRSMTVEEERAYLPILEIRPLPILLRFILEPIDGASKPLEYRLGLHAVSGLHSRVADGQPMDIVLDLSKYAKDSGAGRSVQADKELLSLWPLQVGGNYRIQIENLNPLELPSGIKTEFVMKLGRSKY